MCEKIEDGGPAFPNAGGSDSPLYGAYGMSLRDWFAGQALMGITSNPNTRGDADRLSEGIALYAFKAADAMLAERKKERS